MKYKNVVEEFRERILKELGEKIRMIIVYGSVARKEAKKDSDIDILIVAKERNKEIYDRISRIRTEIDIKNSTLTSLVILSEDEFRNRAKLPFISSVLKEGVVIYGYREGIATES